MTDMRNRSTLKIVALANLAAVLALLATGISLILPSSEAVRLRNSLIASPGRMSDFLWTPATQPAGFLQESASSHPEFAELLAELRGASDQDMLGYALTIARHLMTGPFRGGPIQQDTLTTYRKIIQEGGGYCSDYTQVFNALANTV